MKPTDITPYVWNRLLQTFEVTPDTPSMTVQATAWLARQNNVEDVWNYLLSYEGIIGYGFYLHQLHQHLWHPNEVK